MQGELLLSPYRVLDLTDEKGFLCGKLLGDLGADVIKVEPPGGDPARNIGPFHEDIPHPERSLFWWAFNTSKRGIVLDIGTEEGKETFKRLVETADFVVESFPPGYLGSLGLGYGVLSHVNPRIILTSITPFGQTGPYKHFKASDLVLWAMGGLMYCCGDPDRPPVGMGGGPQAYLHGGLHAAVGTLLAHWHRELTGEGQHVDVSIQAAVARVLGNEPVDWFAEKHLSRRAGNYTIRAGQRLLQIWPCGDGYVSFRLVGGRYGRNIQPLVEWMAEEGSAGGLEKLDWESLDVWKLSDKMEEMEGIFARFFLKHTRAELVEEAIKRRFMLLDVPTVGEVLQNKQLGARDFWTEVAHPELGQKFLYPGAPYKFSLTPWRISRRAPLIGEHNQEVFAELDRIPSQRAAASQAGFTPSPSKGGEQNRPPLDGVKVLDFSWQAAGGFCSAYLADFGAEVVLIESETALSLSRVSAPFKDGISVPDHSYTFAMWNSSKLGVALNLKAPEAREIIRRLVLWADVVSDNFGPGTMARLGMGYDDLRKIKPDIIMLSASALGQTGPYSKFVGFGWHISGPFYQLTGWPDREPIKPHLAYSDHVAPWFQALAVLAALDYHRRTGKGQYIDLSQLEATLGFMSTALLDYSVNRRVQTRKGNRSDRAAPHGAYPCTGEDRWCAITAYTDEEWRGLCQVLGRPAWTKDPKFASVLARKENEEELDRLVGEWTSDHEAEEVMTMLQAAGVAAGVVESCEDLLEKDPQVKHWGLWPLVEHPALGLALQYGWPVRLPKTPYRQRPSPCLGEHTEHVLCELLGIPDEEFVRLESMGVLR